MSKQLATEEVNQELIETYNACKLIPKDMDSIVISIGIGEVMRRIIGRTKIIFQKIDLIARFKLPALSKKKKYIECSISTLGDQYSNISMDAVLLIDALNRFNSLKRKRALENIEKKFPAQPS